MIYCIGDSLTAGTAFGNTLSYPGKLQELTGEEVRNYGIGGESSRTVAIRVGARPLIVDEASEISALAGKMTFLSLSDEEGQEPDILKQNQEDTLLDCLNPVILEGVDGIITRESRGFTFVRRQVGQSVHVPKGSLVTTQIGSLDLSQDIGILWMGTNDDVSMEKVHQLIENIQLILKRLGSHRYIVIGLTADSILPEVDAVNQVLKDTFSEHFYDFRSYLLAHGLEDGGMTFSEEDREKIARKELPACLMKAPDLDYVHGNEIFFSLLAKELYKKLIELSYLQEDEHGNEKI